MTTTTLAWNPPGIGPWEVETAHFPRPMPYFGRHAVHRAFVKGFSEGSARYGLLLSHFEPAYVNGFWYQQPVAFGAPKGAKGPPPKPVLWLLTRLHPGMRARIKTCELAFEKRIWRDDLATWDAKDKPSAIARHATLLAVSPRTLEDAALSTHLRDCEAHVEAMVGLHHKYTFSCILPVGDLIAHVAEWTGETPRAVLGMLRGSTPISRGILASELDTLSQAIKDERAEAMLDGARASDVIAALRVAPGRIGPAARDFFDAIEHRSLTYDIGAKSAGEMPEMLVSAVKASVSGARGDDVDGARAKVDAIRGKVPADKRARFDELLDEARSINRLRDERGIFADGFAIGIGRRAVLEVGRRLAERSLLADAAHAVDLELDEAIALLEGKPGPSADEIAARVEWRCTKSVADVPQFLGGQPGAPPDPAILPAAARRATLAVDAVISNLFAETTETSTKTIVRGISVNDGVYEGIARRIEDASQFDRLKQGDVLVTRSTAPYFNVVLPLLGAIVTDRGGQLCHAAIVAREYGIPGVVGTKVATATIPDGARVRVDGSKGEITILGAPS